MNGMDADGESFARSYWRESCLGANIETPGSEESVFILSICGFSSQMKWVAFLIHPVAMV